MTNLYAYFPDGRNHIDPTAIIGEHVKLGQGNVIGPFAVICGRTVVGDGNWIAPHVSIGTPAEWRGKPLPVVWANDPGDGRVVIGDRNVIREFTTINAGIERSTVVGNDCYLMARSHLGHDAVLDDDVTLATGAQLGGCTTLGRWANIGLGAQVHQRCPIGPGAMVGMAAAVIHPVAPFMTVAGVPAKPIGINRIGLRRLDVHGWVIEKYELAIREGAMPPQSLPDQIREVLALWQSRTWA